MQDLARLARWMAGKAVGLVLSGGGSRGLAHLGVLHALDDAGCPIDIVGGTSQVRSCLAIQPAGCKHVIAASPDDALLDGQVFSCTSCWHRVVGSPAAGIGARKHAGDQLDNAGCPIHVAGVLPCRAPHATVAQAGLALREPAHPPDSLPASVLHLTADAPHDSTADRGMSSFTALRTQALSQQQMYHQVNT